MQVLLYFETFYSISSSIVLQTRCQKGEQIRVPSFRPPTDAQTVGLPTQLKIGFGL